MLLEGFQTSSPKKGSHVKKKKLVIASYDLTFSRGSKKYRAYKDENGNSHESYNLNSSGKLKNYRTYRWQYNFLFPDSSQR